jgi:hypothetical protein
VKLLVAVAEQLPKQFRGETKVGPSTHAQIERRDERLGGLGAEGLSISVT